MLNVRNLIVRVGTKNIVNNITFTVGDGKIFALVGGSGSGKTTTGLAILKLLAPELKIMQGQIILNGKDVVPFSDNQMRPLRGKEVGMVFQEPLYAFNPVFPIGSQIDEVLKYHAVLNSRQRQAEILDLLRMVDLSDPKRVAASYPHQLSGGMRQRAMLAQALAAKPKLLIADEPTSSLDVTIQARIIELFARLKEKYKLSILLITHDLGVVQHLTDEVAVMSAGEIVESGPTAVVLNHPRHEYTQQLLETIKV